MRVAVSIGLGISQVLLALSLARAESDKPIDFLRQIRPILAENCLTCHGPDEATRQSGLRLDSLEHATAAADSGLAAIVPQKSAESELIRRITSTDDADRMPPADSEKSLKPEEIDLLREWVNQGANYATHWAFVAPVKSDPPGPKDDSWTRNDIDRFVLARLRKEELEPSPEASRAALLRRLSLDLTGLPPEVSDVDAFLRDNTPDAYERQVDRLLASPHYGERWARLWLDGARYADSDGFEKDLPRMVWMYRDWVISAFNRDLPYDQLITQQLAGDLLPNAGQDEKVATGFLRNSTINEEGGIDPEQFRMEGNFERMDILGKAVLGITVNCCQCHTHKYDPIPHEEYYRLLAYINEAEEVIPEVYTPEQLLTRERVLSGIDKLENDLQTKRPDWKQQMAAWVERVKNDQPPWESLKLKNSADNAQRYIYNDDLSVCGWGYNPPNTYTVFTADFKDQPAPQTITAFRLEALTDPILPNHGPGRSPNGLFAITQLYVDVFTPGEKDPTRVKLATATADFSNADKLLDPFFEDPNNNRHRVTGPVSYAIDDVDVTAWGIDNGPGRSNVDRKAVFVLAEPLKLKPGQSIRFMLHQDHGGWNSDERYANTVGRFRISTTDVANAVADPLPKKVRDVLHKPMAEWSDEELAAAFSYWRTTIAEWRGVNDEIESLWQQYPRGVTQLALAPRDKMRVTQVLDRGDFLKPKEVVEPGVLSMLQPLPADAPRNRLGLAEWLTDRQAPTTSRSIVNRIWQAYFGIGLVNTPEDFGTQGEIPSNQELLDWLAVELMDRGWSLKELHRLIVTSSTYRQSSATTPELIERDPANRLLARGPRFRVDGETVRDIALVASGLFNAKLGGPPVFPPAPPFLFKPPASYGPKTWNETTGPDRYRRALYTFRFRSVPDPMLSTFDTPAGEAACVRRSRSNTPLQALATLNETMSLECARGLSMRALEHQGNDHERMAYIFRRCVAREPNGAELKELMGLLNDQLTRFAEPDRDPWQLAASDPSHPPLLPIGATPTQAAAWTAVSRLLLNLDETVTKE